MPAKKLTLTGIIIHNDNVLLVESIQGLRPIHGEPQATESFPIALARLAHEQCGVGAEVRELCGVYDNPGEGELALGFRMDLTSLEPSPVPNAKWVPLKTVSKLGVDPRFRDRIGDSTAGVERVWTKVYRTEPKHAVTKLFPKPDFPRFGAVGLGLFRNAQGDILCREENGACSLPHVLAAHGIDLATSLENLLSKNGLEAEVQALSEVKQEPDASSHPTILVYFAGVIKGNAPPGWTFVPPYQVPRFSAQSLVIPRSSRLIVAACGIIENEQGEYLLVEHARRGFEPVGGQVELDEDVLAGVIRETYEESGITATVTGLVGLYQNMGSDISEAKLCLAYRGRAESGEPRASIEHLHAGFYSREDTIRLVQNANVRERTLDALAMHPTPVFSAYRINPEHENARRIVSTLGWV